MALVAVIGSGGKVGSYIVEELATNHNVIAIDISKERLKRFARFNSVSQYECPTVSAIIDVLNSTKPDVVVISMPGSIAFDTIKKLLLQCPRIVDVSFYPEDAFEIEEIALQSGALYIPDAGLAPGLTNIIADLWYNDNAISFKAYVGGLPQNPHPPLYYSAPFNPHDAYDEYLRPARIKQYGIAKEVTPLQTVEWLREFNDSPYPLGAIYTDGLRTLLKTLDYPEMAELTLRYKPHLDYILKAFFQNKLTEPETKEEFIKYASVPAPDITYFYAIAKYKDGTHKTFKFSHYQRGEHPSMSALTGSVALGFVDWILAETPDLIGVHPPEKLANKAAPFVFNRLKKAGIDIRELKQA